MRLDVRSPAFLRSPLAKPVRDAPFAQRSRAVERSPFELEPPSTDGAEQANTAEQAAPTGPPLSAPSARQPPPAAPPAQTGQGREAAVRDEAPPAEADPAAAASAALEAELAAELQRVRANVAGALETFTATGESLRQQAVDDAVQLGLEIARAIIGRELEVTAEPLVDIVRGALQELAEARQVSVRLNPDDVLALEARGLGDEPGLAQVALIGDPALARGDVLVESDLGGVDARLDVRLESIRKALGAAVGRHR